MRTVTLTAPSHWSSYLINGDASSLTEAEFQSIQQWLMENCLDMPVTCQDAGFLTRHDASLYAGASDCQEYLFFIHEESLEALLDDRIIY